jgi:hypothetical protein
MPLWHDFVFLWGASPDAHAELQLLKYTGFFASVF